MWQRAIVLKLSPYGTTQSGHIHDGRLGRPHRTGSTPDLRGRRRHRAVRRLNDEIDQAGIEIEQLMARSPRRRLITRLVAALGGKIPPRHDVMFGGAIPAIPGSGVAEMTMPLMRTLFDELTLDERRALVKDLLTVVVHPGRDVATRVEIK